eukprot:1138652-Pelagomonas_calceolata.AAC.2
MIANAYITQSHREHEQNTWLLGQGNMMQLATLLDVPIHAFGVEAASIAISVQVHNVQHLEECRQGG